MFAQVVPVKRGKISLPFFDYKVPDSLSGTLKVGHLVTIPLRSRTELGIVRSFSRTTAAPTSLIKPITSLVHQREFLSTESLSFLEEIADLYHTSLGGVFRSALPPLQKRKLSKMPTNQPTPPQKEIINSKPVFHSYKNESERRTFITSKLPIEGQLLILVPEVPDCDTISSYFDQKDVCVVTSYLSDKELFARWMEIWSGEKRVIVGTRSALLMSFFDLRTIIVDQEANQNHKSWDQAPRFHARDAALFASRHFGVPVIFAGSAPSVETYYFSRHEVYRVDNSLTPTQRSPQIVDMRKEYRAGNYSPLSLPVEEALENNPSGSVFLFCNRRGSASYMMCRDCSSATTCSTCRRPMTYHERAGELRCHHCLRSEPMFPVCQRCGGANLAYFGAGTEAIAKEYKKRFPNDPREVIEIEGSEESLKKIDRTKDQIIIGTQLAWPHLNWNKLKLVVFVDADTPLFVPEYLSSERVWLSVHDALFRLPENSDLYIQTNRPEERVYTSFGEPAQFYEGELNDRKVFGYPPYKFLLKLFNGEVSQELSLREADRVYAALAELTNESGDITINRPIELFPPLAKGKYWHAVVLKLSYRNYKRSLRSILKRVPETWKVDPNPINLLNP